MFTLVRNRLAVAWRFLCCCSSNWIALGIVAGGTLCRAWPTLKFQYPSDDDWMFEFQGILTSQGALEHFCTFFFFGLFLCRGLTRCTTHSTLPALIGTCIVGAGLGTLIEIVQPFVGRTFDTRDLIVDAAGIALAILVWELARRCIGHRTAPTSWLRRVTERSE